jgi:hypothetical protein
VPGRQEGHHDDDGDDRGAGGCGADAVASR